MRDWNEFWATVGIVIFIALSDGLAWMIHWILGGIVTLFYLYQFIETCLEQSRKNKGQVPSVKQEGNEVR